jgi:phosphoglycolate phosphatase
MIKTVIFDWNGTLLADTQACYDADCHVIRVFGGTCPSLKHYKDTVCIPAVGFYEQHGCKEVKMLKDVQRLGRIFHTFYETRASRCRMRSGAREVLSILKNKSIDALILSNHTNSGIHAQLQRLRIDKFFCGVLGNDAGETVMVKKGKGERLVDYFRKSGILPDEAVIIGDSPEEVEIGKRFNVMPIAITGGYFATWRLKKAKPKHLISHLSELTKIIIQCR